MMLLLTILLITTLIHHTLSTTPLPTTTDPHHHNHLTTHHHPPHITTAHITRHHPLLNLTTTLTHPPQNHNKGGNPTPQHSTAGDSDNSSGRISKRSITSAQHHHSTQDDTNTTLASDGGQGDEHLTQPQKDNKLAKGDDEGGRGAKKRSKRRRKRRRRKEKGTRQGNRQEQRQRGRRRIKDLSMWIDQNQVKMFSGYLMEIFVIHNGRVLPYILDPNFEKQLPVIPAQVENVNFTWCSGGKRYQYTFDSLQSEVEELLGVPTLSIPSQGTVPRRPRVFSVDMRCTGNMSGIATFNIGLIIRTAQQEPIPGMPLQLRLRKECRQQGPDPECDLKCQNGGVCDAHQQCQCSEGYMGQYCNTALCYPQCLNGGSCTTPGRCSCPPGFQGRHCEGGICQNKCKNGGKCIQKDRCKCRRGYFGNWCQYSQCFVACINGGKCRGVNKCRCPAGFGGDHCEVVLPQEEAAAHGPKRCRRRCRHGVCHGAQCQCQTGYTGRWCRRRVGRGGGRQRVWVR